jgi:TonB family protein
LIEYIAYSVVMHLAALLAVLYTPVSVNTSAAGGDKIEVIVTEKRPERKTVIIPPTPGKYAKPRPGKIAHEKEPKGELNPSDIAAGGLPIKLEDYADELKAKVDPIWYAKMQPIIPKLSRVYTTNVLLFLDKYGNVRSVKIMQSSGRSDIDQAALETFKEVGRLPKPPESLIKEGIIWDFTVSERM